jgi:periplasmic protein TonB
MNFLKTCTVIVSLCTALPILSQTQSAANNGSSTSTAGDGSNVDLSGFREEIASKNKALNDQVNAQKALVKKNSIIIQEAKKIDAANKKLAAERKQLDQQNAQFEAERRAMMPDASEQTPQQPPVYTRPTSVPARTESGPPVRMELTSTAINNNPVDRQPSSVDSGVRAPINAPATQQQPASQQQQPQSQSQSQQQQPGSTPAAVLPASAATATVVASAQVMRVPEGVSMNMLLTPIRPVYPQIAQTARVEGVVVLDAVISKAGTIESLHMVSGPEMLRRAAMDAVQQARYQPYRVNGETVQVATTVTVVFKMKS